METKETVITDLQAAFLALIRSLVDDPEAVRMKVTTVGSKTVLQLHVAEVDLGKIIGKQGRTVRALRVLLMAAGMKYTRRFELEIGTQPASAIKRN